MGPACDLGGRGGASPLGWGSRSGQCLRFSGRGVLGDDCPGRGTPLVPGVAHWWRTRWEGWVLMSQGLSRAVTGLFVSFRQVRHTARCQKEENGGVPGLEPVHFDPILLPDHRGGHRHGRDAAGLGKHCPRGWWGDSAVGSRRCPNSGARPVCSDCSGKQLERREVLSPDGVPRSALLERSWETCPLDCQPGILPQWRWAEPAARRR